MLLFFMCSGGLAAGQSRPVVSVANTPFLRSLLRMDSIQIVQSPTYNPSMQLLDLAREGYGDRPQHLVRQGNGLWLMPMGTGKLYSSDSLRLDDSLLMRRVDSTELDGYNLNAYVFPHRGRIHNLGGYGFWHWNGQLRAYNDRMREWEIVPLNREVAVAMGSPECFIWHDMRRERIYSLRSVQGNEAVRGEEIRLDEEVRMLDLAAGEWTSLGTPSMYVRNRLEERKILAASDTGLVIIHHNAVEYWLPGENRILILSDVTPLAEMTARMYGMVTWMRGGKLYRGQPGTGGIDSLVLHTGMFRDAGERIYLPSSRVSLPDLAIFLTSAVLVFLMGVFSPWMLRSSTQRFHIVAADEGDIGTSFAKDSGIGSPLSDASGSASDRSAVFDEIERTLLLLLIRNTRVEDRLTTSHEINRVLGVGGKSLDMQKRKRSDVIRSINRKYRLVRPERVMEPIVKQRGGLDARLTEYGIRLEELPTLTGLLDMH